MSQSIPIPPLIPLPEETQNAVGDDKEDVFATLFSPATPRGSPTMRPVPDEPPEPSRHARTASVESDFGSFVSVPSTEDPLHQQEENGGLAPFTPVDNFEFFDKFTEDAKLATEKKKTDLLDELFQNDKDPTAFLRGGENVQGQRESLIDLDLGGLEVGTNTPTNYSRAATPLVDRPLGPASTTDVNLTNLTIPTSDHPPLPTVPPASTESDTRLVDEPFPLESSPPRFTEELEGDPSHEAFLNNDASLSDFDPLEDEHLERRSRHPTRNSNWTESAVGMGRDFSPELTRSPSLPPTPIRISKPEVQRTQSFFAPSSLVSSTSNLTSRWMSSLLSRPQPPPPRPKTPDYEVYGSPPPSLARVSTISGPSITHGTPFGAQPYIPPSGAPGFAGDRTWDKGFQFDKENVERASLKLAGRKEVTVGVLTVAIADKLRPYLPALKRLARSWSLLYSLDQHGISLNTLYTRCEAHTGGALLIMRDSNDAMFGVWMGEGIRQCKGSYYGSGESFLFRVLSDDGVRVYKWTGKNDYVALCEAEYISFGGGDGHYGLYLDDTLSDGSSARCPTFDNEPLCSAGPRQGENVTFECVGLEVWGVG